MRKYLPCDALNEDRLSCYPAKSASRSYCLGEGIQANYTTVSIEAQVRWDKRVNKLITAGLGPLVDICLSRVERASSTSLLGSGGWELHVPVRIILDDDDIELAAEGINVLSPLGRKNTAGRVMAHTRLVSDQTSENRTRNFYSNRRNE